MAQGDVWLYSILDIYIYIYILFFFEDFNGLWKLKRHQIKSYKTTIARRIRCMQAACNKAETREQPPQWAQELPWFVAGRKADDAHGSDNSQDKPDESSEAGEDEDEEEEDEEEEEEEEDDKDADSEVETIEWTYAWDHEVKCAFRTCLLQHPERTRLEMAKAPQPPDAAAEDNDPYFATFADDSTHVQHIDLHGRYKSMRGYFRVVGLTGHGNINIHIYIYREREREGRGPKDII